jgi:hypothetical protein
MRKITQYDDEKGREVSIYLDGNNDVAIVEVYFYCPVPLMNFSIEKVISGNKGCGGCGGRNQEKR